MAVLARAALAACVLAGCYSPDLRDCTVSCASSADCAGAQVCNAGMCAAKDVTCSTMTTQPPGDASADAGVISDASHTPIDAPRMIDAAPPPPDTPAPVIVHLHVDGHGQLTMGTHSCQGDCDVPVTHGAVETVLAQGLGDQAFRGWTQGPCVGSQLPTCTFTASANLTVGARFHKEN